jgi:hypothetical protein
LTASRLRYLNVQQSKELEEYQTLYKTVKSSEFIDNKKILVNRKYKDTQEYRDMKRFEKLSNDSKLTLYFKIKNSKELAEYLAFEKTPQFLLIGNRKEEKKSSELVRMKKFGRSKGYKIYSRFHESFVLQEYADLKEKISTTEFKKSNAFWADKYRWQKTKEAELEQRFNELAKNEDIIFFQKTDPSKYNEIDKYTKVFSDEFSWNTLKASSWEYGFHFKQDDLKNNYSFVNELQANTEGDNVVVEHGFLRIITKEQKKEATAWDPKHGFVKHTFDYTSGVINAADKATRKYGAFKAKIRFTGDKRVSHAFWLVGDKRVPHINICKCENGHIEVGLHSSYKFDSRYASNIIKGINTKDFYIYMIVWTEKEIIWYINNVEVFRTSNDIPSEGMYPMLNSFISKGKKGGHGSMDIDYIEIFEINTKKD